MSIDRRPLFDASFNVIIIIINFLAVDGWMLSITLIARKKLHSTLPASVLVLFLVVCAFRLCLSVTMSVIATKTVTSIVMTFSERISNTLRSLH